MEGICKKTFQLDLFEPWLQGSIIVSLTDVKVYVPNAIKAGLPMGENAQSIPLRNISSVETYFGYDLKKLSAGITQIILGFILRFCFESTYMKAVVFLLIFLGTKKFLNGFKTILRIQRSGSDYFLRVPVNCKRQMRQVKRAIDKALTYEAKKTDLYIHMESLANAFADSLAGKLSEKYLRSPDCVQKTENNAENKEDYAKWLEKMADEGNTKNVLWNIIMPLYPYAVVFLLYFTAGVFTTHTTNILEEKVKQTEETETIQYDMSLRLNDYEYFYFPILQEYLDVALGNETADSHPHVNERYYSNVARLRLQDRTIFPYALLADLNQDGIPELFISICYEKDSGEDEFRLIDMYTFCGGEGKPLFNDKSMGYHNIYDICDNGTIRCNISNEDIDDITQPVEVKYYTLDESGEIAELESMLSGENGFQEFAEQYSLYEAQRWNNLDVWENPLKRE